MPSVPYIEYTNDQGIWVDIYFPEAKQFVTFGPYAQRHDRCPRCTNPGFVVTNGNGNTVLTIAPPSQPMAMDLGLHKAGTQLMDMEMNHYLNRDED